MGAEPPRQTEIRISLPTTFSLKRQLAALSDAHSMTFPTTKYNYELDLIHCSLSLSLSLTSFSSGRFGFPMPPDKVVALIKQYATTPLALSISIASDDNFVKIAIVVPQPGGELLIRLSQVLQLSQKKIGMVRLLLRAYI